MHRREGPLGTFPRCEYLLLLSTDLRTSRECIGLAPGLTGSPLKRGIVNQPEPGFSI